MHEIDEPRLFANGGGAQRLGGDRQLQSLLQRQLTLRPRRIEDHMNLLAHANRRVAETDATVSPHCHVSFINADGRYEAASRVFADKGTSLPFHLPVLRDGFDLSVAAKFLREAFRADQAGEPIPSVSAQELRDQMRRRP
jgi:hypothetical protein